LRIPGVALGPGNFAGAGWVSAGAGAGDCGALVGKGQSSPDSRRYIENAQSRPFGLFKRGVTGSALATATPLLLIVSRIVSRRRRVCWLVPHCAATTDDGAQHPTSIRSVLPLRPMSVVRKQERIASEIVGRSSGSDSNPRSDFLSSSQSAQSLAVGPDTEFWSRRAWSRVPCPRGLTV